MPALAFFAVAGSVLIALLFLADATLEKSDSPVIATSQRSGLPESSYRPDDVQILTTVPAPAPDMRSEAVAFANADAPRNTKPLQNETKDEPSAVAIAPQSRSAVAQHAAKRPVSEVPSNGARAFASTTFFDRIRVHGF